MPANHRESAGARHLTAGRRRRIAPVLPSAAVALDSSRRVVSGTSAAFRGLRFASSHPEVRRIYRQLLVVLFFAALALTALLSGALWYFTALADDASGWVVAGVWILRIAGGLVVLLASPLLALIVVNALFPFLGERAFVGAMRALDPARADALAAAEGMSFSAGLWASLRRLLHFLGLTLLAFALTLVPVVGALLGPAFQLWSTSRALTWELLDPYFDRRSFGYAEQRAYLKAHSGPIVGFGLPLSFILAVPLVGPLFFGLAQAGAALLVVEVLEPEG